MKRWAPSPGEGRRSSTGEGAATGVARAVPVEAVPAGEASWSREEGRRILAPPYPGTKSEGSRPGDAASEAEQEAGEVVRPAWGP